MATEFRETGIDVVGAVPWGTHFCNFYETKQDLLETLIPYFKAGLENKEFCLWVVSSSELITAKEAQKALADVVPDLGRYLAAGQLEVLNAADWYVEDNVFNLERVVSAWAARLEQALARGFKGMRVSGDTFWLGENDWKGFRSYEKQINESISDRPMTLLCTYPLTKSGATLVLDVAKAHQLAIVRRQGEWEVIESPELLQARVEIARQQRAEDDLRRQKEILQKIFDHIPVMINFVDADGSIKLVNREWERTLGWTLEEIREQGLDIFAKCYPDFDYRQYVLKFVSEAHGEWRDFKTRVRDGRVMDQAWVTIHLSDGTSIGIGQDITERKRTEKALDERLRFETLVTELSAAFANLATNEADQEIEKWLKSLVEFLSVDRASFLQFEKDSSRLFRSHSYTVPGIEPLPPPPFGLKDQFPWITEQLRLGVTVKWSRIRDDMGEEAMKEMEYAARLGVKSALNIPVLVGGSVICAITFTSQAHRDWPDAMVARLRLVGEIFAGAVQRKRAEAALRRSEDHLRLVIDAIPTMAWSLRPDGVVDFLNQRWVDYVGLSLEEYVTNPTGHVHPEDLTRVMEKWRQDMAAEEPNEDEFRLRRADGEYRWFLVRNEPLRDEQGNLVKWYGVSIEIEDRKQAEEQLKHNERQLAEAQRLAHIGSWDWDLRTNAVTWSDELYNVFGLQPGTVRVAEEVDRFIHPDDLELGWNTVKRAVANKEPYDYYHRILRPDGTERIARSRGAIMCDELGQPIKVFGATQDVTDLKRAEEKLKATSDQLRALSARMESAREEEGIRIAREIHDELGSNLTRLKWDLEIMGKEGLPAGDRERLANARRKISEMVALVDETVDTVRRISAELRPSALDDLGLGAALRLQARQFQDRTGIMVECDCSAESLKLSSRQSTAIFRICEEALTNVMRHSCATRVEVKLKTDQDDLVLTIHDNGRGITHSELADSLSLGLLGMRERAHLLGGEVEITGIEDQGTVVTARVPIHGKVE